MRSGDRDTARVASDCLAARPRAVRPWSRYRREGDTTLNEHILTELLVRYHLAPLRDLPPARRAALATTLREWLVSGRDPEAVAAALDLPAPTVREHLRELRQLFGPELDDPSHYYAIAAALRLVLPRWREES